MDDSAEVSVFVCFVFDDEVEVVPCRFVIPICSDVDVVVLQLAYEVILFIVVSE